MGFSELRSKLVPFNNNKPQSVLLPGSGTVTAPPAKRVGPTPPRPGSGSLGVGGGQGCVARPRGGLAWIAASDYS